jgi:hypothetical protein
VIQKATAGFFRSLLMPGIVAAAAGERKDRLH